MSAYSFIDHKFDLVVVGAGGSGLAPPWAAPRPG